MAQEIHTCNKIEKNAGIRGLEVSATGGISFKSTRLQVYADDTISIREYDATEIVHRAGGIVLVWRKK